MKNKIITAMLCAAMTAHAHQDTNTVSTNKLVWPAVFVLTVGVVGSAVVIYVHEKNNKNAVIPLLTLQRSPDHHAWEDVCTKTNVQLNGTNRLEIFRQEIDAEPHRDSNFYRTFTP